MSNLKKINEKILRGEFFGILDDILLPILKICNIKTIISIRNTDKYNYNLVEKLYKKEITLYYNYYYDLKISSKNIGYKHDKEEIMVEILENKYHRIIDTIKNNILKLTDKDFFKYIKKYFKHINSYGIYIYYKKWLVKNSKISLYYIKKNNILLETKYIKHFINNLIKSNIKNLEFSDVILLMKDEIFLKFSKFIKKITPEIWIQLLFNAFKCDNTNLYLLLIQNINPKLWNNKYKSIYNLLIKENNYKFLFILSIRNNSYNISRLILKNINTAEINPLNILPLIEDPDFKKYYISFYQEKYLFYLKNQNKSYLYRQKDFESITYIDNHLKLISF